MRGGDPGLGVIRVELREQGALGDAEIVLRPLHFDLRLSDLALGGAPVPDWNIQLRGHAGAELIVAARIVKGKIIGLDAEPVIDSQGGQICCARRLHAECGLLYGRFGGANVGAVFSGHGLHFRLLGQFGRGLEIVGDGEFLVVGGEEEDRKAHTCLVEGGLGIQQLALALADLQPCLDDVD